jgi:hypothetical protein
MEIEFVDEVLRCHAELLQVRHSVRTPSILGSPQVSKGHRWPKGQSGNPAGRPVGARQRISEQQSGKSTASACCSAWLSRILASWRRSHMACCLAGAGASAASAAPPALVQCATKAATKAKRRALGAPTELNALPMVAALNFRAKKGSGHSRRSRRRPSTSPLAPPTDINP